MTKLYLANFFSKSFKSLFYLHSGGFTSLSHKAIIQIYQENLNKEESEEDDDENDASSDS